MVMYTYLCILFIHAVLQLERIILYSNISLLLYVVYNDVLITNNSTKMIFGLFCLMILCLSFMHLYFFLFLFFFFSTPLYVNRLFSCIISITTFCFLQLLAVLSYTSHCQYNIFYLLKSLSLSVL